jgi:putative ATP-grasp target RiPP
MGCAVQMTSRAIWRPQDMFALSAPAGHGHAVSREPVKGGRPFGLRCVGGPDPGANCELDLASVRLDEMTQIAVMTGGAGDVPAFKHTSGQTSTTTNVQDRKNTDSDTDHEPDRPR